MSVIGKFVNKLFSRLINSERICNSGIIKKHSDNLEEFGEFSFPLLIEPWKRYLKESTKIGDVISIFNVAYPDVLSVNDACVLLKEDSDVWPLTIKKCKVSSDRVYLFLDRKTSIEKCFLYLSNSFETAEPSVSGGVFVSIDEGSESDVTHYRLNLLSKVTKKLSVLNGFRLVHEEDPKDYHIHLTTKSSKVNQSGKFSILCAPAINGKSGSKETELTTEKYLKQRVTDMKLKAQHKYRVVVTDEDAWNRSLAQLGEASANFDLLQVKPSHSVYINMSDGGTGCSKGVSFILYNSARLASIINTFRENVKKGTYSSLPPISDIDFELLNDEDEWKIIFNFILAYKDVLKSSFTLEAGKCIVASHQLCSYLSSLVGRFSMYYRRIKILMEPREHLLPKIYARMHLLKAIQDVITNVLAIFDITLLSEM